MRVLLVLPIFLLTTSLALAAPSTAELQAAVAAHDVATVKALLDQGADPNGRYMHEGVGLAPMLMHALDRDDPALIQALLAAGADPNQTRNGDGSSPLTHAAARGWSATVETLLKGGADKGYLVPNGAGALGFAAAYGKLDTCRVLLDQGADVNQVQGDGNLPLGYAIGHHQTETPVLLLERGADPLKLIAGHDDPWSMALREGNEPAVRAMLDMGIPATRMSWIYELQRPAIVVAATAGHLDLVKLLADRGADPLATAPDGTNPIGEAVWAQHPAVVAWLLERGADPNWRQNKDTTLVLSAVYRDNLEILDLLAAKGADLHLPRTSDGGTPWAISAAENHPAILRRLLELGIDPETPVGDHTAAWEGGFHGNVDTLHALIDHHAKLDVRHPKWGTTPLFEAVKRGHLEAVRVLLEEGADPNLTREGFDENGVSGAPPLVEAIATRKFEIALLLLDHGADPNKAAIKGYPPLYMCLNTDRLDLMKSLLDHGADPNTSWGWGSMLLWCIKEDRNEMALTLLEHDADPNTASVAGEWWSPLHLAAYRRNLVLVQALIDYGADALARSNMGRTALDVALDGGDEEVIRLVRAVTQSQEDARRKKLEEEAKNPTPIYRE